MEEYIPRKSIYKVYLVEKATNRILLEKDTVAWTEAEAIELAKVGTVISSLGLVREDVEFYTRMVGCFYDEGFCAESLAKTPEIAAADLPSSMHIAALTAVDTVNKKGTVVRKWMGENYTYTGCYCSAQALAEYQAGRLKLYNNAFGILAPENADSFVLVYFVSENPYDESLEIPVIVDKLVK